MQVKRGLQVFGDLGITKKNKGSISVYILESNTYVIKKKKKKNSAILTYYHPNSMFILKKAKNKKKAITIMCEKMKIHLKLLVQTNVLVKRSYIILKVKSTKPTTERVI